MRGSIYREIEKQGQKGVDIEVGGGGEVFHQLEEMSRVRGVTNRVQIQERYKGGEWKI